MHGRARGMVQGMKHFELFHRYELKYLARVHARGTEAGFPTISTQA